MNLFNAQQGRNWKKYVVLYVVFVIALLLTRLVFWVMPNYQSRVGLIYLWPAAITAFTFLAFAAYEGRIRGVWVSSALTLWLLVVNIINGDYGFEYNLTFCLGVLISIGVGFPLFFLIQPTWHRRVLWLVGGLYVAAMLLVALFSLYAALNDILIASPFTEYLLGIQTGRLYVFNTHPNEVAAAFNIAFQLCLLFTLLTKHRWIKALFFLGAAVFYAIISTTISRTSMIIVSLSGGFYLFIQLSQLRWFKHRLLSFVTRGIAGLALTVLLFFCFAPVMSAIDSYHPTQAKTMVTSALADDTADAQNDSVQNVSVVTTEPATSDLETRSLLRDLPTFTGRTDIWGAAIDYIRLRPITLLIGQTDAQVARVPHKMLGWDVYHQHNVWVEILLLGGLPGLLLYAILIVKVLVSDFQLLAVPGTNEKWQRYLAGITLLMMLNGFTEIYPSWSGNIMDLMFFILLGAAVNVATARKEALRSAA